MEEERVKDNKILENKEVNIQEKEKNIDNEKEIIETEFEKVNEQVNFLSYLITCRKSLINKIHWFIFSNHLL